MVKSGFDKQPIESFRHGDIRERKWVAEMGFVDRAVKEKNLPSSQLSLVHKASRRLNNEL